MYVQNGTTSANGGTSPNIKPKPTAAPGSAGGKPPGAGHRRRNSFDRPAHFDPAASSAEPFSEPSRSRAASEVKEKARERSGSAVEGNVRCRAGTYEPAPGAGYSENTSRRGDNAYPGEALVEDRLRDVLTQRADDKGKISKAAYIELFEPFKGEKARSAAEQIAEGISVEDLLQKLLPAFVAPTAWGKGIKKAGNALLVWEGIKTLQEVKDEDKKGDSKTEASSGEEKKKTAEEASASSEGAPAGGLYQKNGIWMDADGNPVEGAM